MKYLTLAFLVVVLIFLFSGFADAFLGVHHKSLSKERDHTAKKAAHKKKAEHGKRRKMDSEVFKEVMELLNNRLKGMKRTIDGLKKSAAKSRKADKPKM